MNVICIIFIINFCCFVFDISGCLTVFFMTQLSNHTHTHTHTHKCPPTRKRIFVLVFLVVCDFVVILFVSDFIFLPNPSSREEN